MSPGRKSGNVGKGGTFASACDLDDFQPWIGQHDDDGTDFAVFVHAGDIGPGDVGDVRGQAVDLAHFGSEIALNGDGLLK